MKRIRILAATLVVAAMVAVGVTPPALADGVELEGQSIDEPSTDPENPTPLTAGRWQTTLSATGSSRHFLYERTSRDSRVIIGVNAAGVSRDQGFELEAVALDADNASCGDVSASTDINAPTAVLGVNLVVGPGEHGNRDSRCLISDRIRFTIGRGNNSFDDDLPLSITIVEESALENAYEPLPEVPEERPVFVPPPAGESTEVPGGVTFAEAPLLEDGTITGTIAQGQQLFYRVHLDWGQSVAAQLDVEPLPDWIYEATNKRGVALELFGYNPVRRAVSSSFEETDGNGRVQDEDPLELTWGHGPVRYLNRYDGPSAFVPGDYYISVVADPSDGSGPVQVPFSLTVEVQGEAVPGPGYAEEQPFLIGPDQRSTVASGTPRMRQDEDASWLTPRRIGGLGLGVVGLLCLGFGALRLRRR